VSRSTIDKHVPELAGGRRPANLEQGSVAPGAVGATGSIPAFDRH
jgi:hypothetical protein